MLLPLPEAKLLCSQQVRIPTGGVKVSPHPAVFADVAKKCGKHLPRAAIQHHLQHSWRLLVQCCFIHISCDPGVIGVSHSRLRGRRMLSKAKSSAFLCCLVRLGSSQGCTAQVTLAKPALSFSLHMGSTVELHLALIIWKTQKVKAGLELGILWDGFWLRMCPFTSPENLLAKLKQLLKNFSWMIVCQGFPLLKLRPCNYKWNLFLNRRELILMS